MFGELIEAGLLNGSGAAGERQAAGVSKGTAETNFRKDELTWPAQYL
jgi:hypothetical protein